MTQGCGCQQEERGHFCVAQNRGGWAAGEGVIVVMMTCLMVWSAPPDLTDVEATLVWVVVATGAAGEMKDGPESPTE